MPVLSRIIGVPQVPRMLMLGDLVAGSTPDTGQASVYKGPPIGYSCRKVVHKDGYEEIFGDENGVRGIYQVNCAGHGGCARCDRKWTMVMSRYYHSLPGLPLRAQAAPPDPPPPPEREPPARPRAHSLNATAEPFTPFTYPTIPPKPTKAEIKADLTEREARMKKEIETLRANAVPNVTVPSGPRAMNTSRYNHETGQTFGPLTINNKAQKTSRRRGGPRRHPDRLTLHEDHSVTSTPTVAIKSEPFYTPDVNDQASCDRQDTAVPRGE